MNELQRTEQWHRDRLGKATGSRMGELTARLKNGGWGASRRNYMVELIVERLTNTPFPSYVSRDMEAGTEREPQAIAAYGFQNGVDVEEVGFIDHPTITMSGASSDGLVGTSGLVEIKCPKHGTHYEYYSTRKIDLEYVKQMQWNMGCRPERLWCDFVSYHPDFPPDMQLVVITVKRDNNMIAQLEADVIQFLKELDLELAGTAARREALRKALRDSVAAA